MTDSAPTTSPEPARKYALCKAPFDECTFTIAIYGEDLRIEDVSQRLGCAPTQSHERGGVKTFGAWLLSIEAAPPKGPSELVHELLDRLPAAPHVWAALARDYEVQARFAFHASTLTGCFELTPSAAERLASTGAVLAFHLYWSG